MNRCLPLLLFLNSSCAIAMAQGAPAETMWQVSWRVPGNTLTGILVIQQPTPVQVRLVMVNEFGVKYFDARADSSGTAFQYILPAMDKDSFKPILARSLMLVAMQADPGLQKSSRLVEVKFRRGLPKLTIRKGAGRASLFRHPDDEVVVRVRSFPIRCNFDLKKIEQHVEE